MHIPFKKVYLTGKEKDNIQQALENGHLSGDGLFTEKCHQFFKTKYGFENCLLTTSCTHALEMVAQLIEITKGDEVILPSYTFTSTANAFLMRGANIILADSLSNHPNIDLDKVESLITSKTKALVLIHYAGFPCDMDKARALADKYNLFLIEDAAQGLDSFYKNQAIGSFGDFATFSFHDTKNIVSGEGGLLVVNNQNFISQAFKIRDKGTNRKEFEEKKVAYYEWSALGSSYLPSDLLMAVLYAQLEELDAIQSKRKAIWLQYFDGLVELQEKGYCQLPFLSEYSQHNANFFYVICKSKDERRALSTFLKAVNIPSAFHYIPLHTSKFYLELYPKEVASQSFPHASKFGTDLLRLPFFTAMTGKEIDYVISHVREFYL